MSEGGGSFGELTTWSMVTPWDLECCHMFHDECCDGVIFLVLQAPFY